jgi:hypothetical protein
MVITSSYNITVTQSRMFNDMLVVSGNQELYDAHVAVFEDYLHQRKTDDRYNEPGGRISIPSAATYTAGLSGDHGREQIGAAKAIRDSDVRVCRATGAAAGVNPAKMRRAGPGGRVGLLVALDARHASHSSVSLRRGRRRRRL